MNRPTLTTPQLRREVDRLSDQYKSAQAIHGRQLRYGESTYEIRKRLRFIAEALVPYRNELKRREANPEMYEHLNLETA